jgi:hypothetical protein
VENRHHVLEPIALYWGRARVAPNLRLAGGPVSAGGDQGRDVESYFSYYEREGAADTIVFICTTRKDDGKGERTRALESKIKRDITSVMAREPHPEIIYAFLTEDVPPSSRHRIEDWVREEYGIRVEIIDGSALARDLAEDDLLWLARVYLHIAPSELASFLPDLDRCGVAARAAIPLPAGLTSEITFRPDGSSLIALDTEPGTEPLQIGPIRIRGEVAERVAQAVRYGETIRLIRDDSVKEFEAPIDPRVADLLEGMQHELVLRGRIGDPKPFRLRVETYSQADVPYGTIQSHGTHRCVITSPLLPIVLQIDFLGGDKAILKADLKPSNTTLLWNLLRLLHAVRTGHHVFLQSLERPAEVRFDEILASLSAAFEQYGILDPLFLRFAETLALVEYHANVELSPDLPFSPEDLAVLDTLYQFFTVGRSRLDATFSVGVIAREDHEVSDGQFYVAGPNVRLRVAGVEIPIGNVLLLLDGADILVNGRRVRRVRKGQHFRVETKLGFTLQRRS